MRILLTGGAGFIGAHLTPRLLAAGHRVVVLDSLSPQVHGEATPPMATEVEFVRGDVRDSPTVAQVMRGVDAVCHLAAETGVGQSQYEIARYVSVNAHGTAVVLEAAAAARVRHIVLASSRAVYGEGLYRCSGCALGFAAGGRNVQDMDNRRWEIRCPQCGHAASPVPTPEDCPFAPVSVYGVTKQQQEELCRLVARVYGQAATIFRFFNVFGPGQSLTNPYTGVLGTFLRRAARGHPIEIYEDGAMLRDYVYVADVAETLDLCLSDPEAAGGVLNVGSGSSSTLREIAEDVFHALGTPPQIEVTGRYRVGDVRHTIADVQQLRKVRGDRPMTPFRDGLREYVTWAMGEDALLAAAPGEDETLTARDLLRQGRGA